MQNPGGKLSSENDEAFRQLFCYHLYFAYYSSIGRHHEQTDRHIRTTCSQLFLSKNAETGNGGGPVGLYSK
jgi:hypothetical protein